MTKKLTDEELEQKVKELETEIGRLKKEGKALREGQDRFIKAFMAGPDCITITRFKDGKIIDANDHFYQTTGRSRDEVIGKTSAEINNWADPDDRDLFVKTLKDTGVVTNLETCFKNKDGSASPYLMSARLIEINGEKCVISITRDISDRKQAEQKIRESEERYRLIFNGSRDSIFITAPDAKLADVNDAASELTGYSREELKKMSIPDLHDKVDLYAYETFLNRIMAGEPITSEAKILRKDGTKVDTEFSNKRVSIGGAYYMHTVARDVTERKQAEENLKREKEFTTSLINNAPTYFVAVDNDGKVIMMNQKMLDGLGYTKEEVVGKDYLLNFVPEKRKETLSCIFNKLTNEQVHTLNENWILSIDGQERLVEWHGVPVLDENGRLQYSYGIGIDITERKQTEQELKENEEKYRQLFEMESDAIFLIENETGKILEVNPAGSILYGYTREELLKMDHTQVSAEPSDTRQATLEQRDNVPIRWHKKKDGTVFPVEITARHFIWKDKPVHIAAIRDIEFRMKAEEEKKQIESQLQQAQKMEAIGTLAGGIAHDFNNILGAIIGYAELSLIDTKEKDPVRYNLEQILRAGNRAKDLIKQILTFSRQSEHDKKPIRIGPLIKEAAKLMRASISANIEIHTDVLVESDLVLADPIQLHQVLINLCSNAGYAMRENGGVLELRLTEMDLDAQSMESHPELLKGSYLKLEVSDTGCGISPGVITRIFDPFFTTKERGDGTGMGLATVHGIVNDHGGTIRISSELGRGTRFDIFLPKLKAAQEREKEEELIITGGNESILLVDDEAILIDMGKQMLEYLGYKVVTRTSSVEALEAFRAQPNKFDLVITDMAMPNMNGVRLTKELLTIRSDIPIVLCTGYSDQIDEEKASEVGIKAYVMKPVVINDLARIIRKVLDKG